MSKYNLEFCANREDPAWLVLNGDAVVFESTVHEEAECMLEECQYFERAKAEYEMFHNQESEFDYV